MENQNKNIKNTKISEIEECDEPLAQPGKIFLAEIHGSAQHFLKIKKLSKYIRFCKCCLLPSETPGVVVPYTCLDNKEDFGIGIHLYFVYIKFCIITTFIGLCLSSIPTMVLIRRPQLRNASVQVSAPSLSRTIPYITTWRYPLRILQDCGISPWFPEPGKRTERLITA